MMMAGRGSRNVGDDGCRCCYNSGSHVNYGDRPDLFCLASSTAHIRNTRVFLAHVDCDNECGVITNMAVEDRI